MARELRAQGYDVISLSLGEPDFDTPDFIKEAAYQALKDGYTKYTPVAGLPELTKVISEKFKRDNGLDYKPDQIVVVTSPNKPCTTFVRPCSIRVTRWSLFSPYWVSYLEIVKLSGGVPVEVYAGVARDFKPAATIGRSHQPETPSSSCFLRLAIPRGRFLRAKSRKHIPMCWPATSTCLS